MIEGGRDTFDGCFEFPLRLRVRLSTSKADGILEQDWQPEALEQARSELDPGVPDDIMP